MRVNKKPGAGRGGGGEEVKDFEQISTNLLVNI